MILTVSLLPASMGACPWILDLGGKHILVTASPVSFHFSSTKGIGEGSQHNRIYHTVITTNTAIASIMVVRYLRDPIIVRS